MILKIDTIVISNFAVAAATLILAIIAIVNIIKTNRIMREQNRPYIALECLKFGTDMVYVINVGRTAARDISIKIVADNEEEDIIILDLKIPYIAPGREISRQAQHVEYHPTGKASISYYPDWKKWRPYKDKICFDARFKSPRRPAWNQGS